MHTHVRTEWLMVLTDAFTALLLLRKDVETPLSKDPYIVTRATSPTAMASIAAVVPSLYGASLDVSGVWEGTGAVEAAVGDTPAMVGECDGNSVTEAEVPGAGAEPFSAGPEGTGLTVVSVGVGAGLSAGGD